MAETKQEIELTTIHRVPQNRRPESSGYYENTTS